ncbi:alpha/beta hydrolase [Nocardiopsis synnemataformans]|uniref:alpha/beta hydrolase n=1 Tax=Nocardiopsis synnemataformans TaxID=61305 RepID=UPI003EB77AD5
MGRRWSAGRSLPPMVVVCLAGSLVAAAPAAAEERGEAPTTALEWGACPEDVQDETHPLECATVPVPMDYDDPEGAEIEIMVSRLASTDPDQRRGVLLLNPGGPGGSGLSMPAGLASLGIPASVLNSYDLIGMDTRGVGHSSAVSCGFTTDQEYLGNIPPYAVDEAAVTERAGVAEAAADQCARSDDNEQIRHISTANMARDLDRIRAALGEEKASFFGLSYGSALGAAYASMFPESTDRIVLDSNIGDTFLDYDGMRRYALGFEETFPDFAAWAAERDGSYGLGDSPEQVRETYFETATRLDEEGPVAGLDGHLFRLSIFAALYSERSYAQTAQMWQSVRLTDEEAVRQHLEESGLGGAPVGGAGAATGELSPGDNAWTVFLATTCNDVEWPEDLATYQEGVAEDREKYPMYGAASANVMPCAYWTEPSEPAVEITGEGPSNVLIMQNLRDPVTPHLGGVLLDEKFGQRSRLVSVDDSGHGTYVYGDNPCAWDVATSYLVDGEFPEQDVSCGASGASGLGLDGQTQRSRAETLGQFQGTA